MLVIENEIIYYIYDICIVKINFRNILKLNGNFGTLSFEIPMPTSSKLMFDKKENLLQTLCTNKISCKLLNMHLHGNAPE